MSAVILSLRPFQTARDAARKVGWDDKLVIRSIVHEQAEGRDGNDIAGALRRKAWEVRNSYRSGPLGPGGAA
ncbi:hypothetical protein ATCM_03735 [Stenotrophomonas sp. ATCM1_4]|uniref:hypothetical protein n=1 Tax=Stenotrophomonas sp. ATCM1_4 TaxID=2259330 RepID=UPI001048BC32|nr:hypothetical protein [Stenotrophomonas sp. ATCM1_4]TDB26828.1 hypothetical protein ATCM_03735 [Stenotrophomonas sp. ATCM1_4]